MKWAKISVLLDGVEVVTDVEVPDDPETRVRMSAGTLTRILSEAGYEPVSED